MIHCFPSSDHRSHFNLELAVVKKLWKAQRVWLRSQRGQRGQRGTEVALHRHDPASNRCTVQVGFQHPTRAHTCSCNWSSYNPTWMFYKLAVSHLKIISASRIFVHSSHFLRQNVYHMYSQLLWYLLVDWGGLGCFRMQVNWLRVG